MLYLFKDTQNTVDKEKKANQHAFVFTLISFESVEDQPNENVSTIVVLPYVALRTANHRIYFLSSNGQSFSTN